MQVYQVIPLINAVIYAVGALCIKRATTSGVGPWRTTFVSNLVLFVAAAPLWFFGRPLESFAEYASLFAVGTCFFLGQLFTCLALHKGDVSLHTPLMGTKTVFVALIVWLVFGERLELSVWLGAFLSAVAILLMRSRVSGADRSKVAVTIYLALASAATFAASDALTQHFGASLGFHKVVAGCFSTVMLYSFALVPMFKSPMSGIARSSWNWLLLGTVLMAIQAGLMAYVLTVYGQATVVNVIYSSRGIWSVVLVWVVGHWFSNTEQHLGASVLLRRLFGAALLIAAIVVVVGN